mmetsp:Transcript_45938/g.70317  ORF Transcript_45938/g.70317 Transcript_45938/m.70317 type:complete len:239 (-) Transcript_45938:89-805(-)
MRVSVLCSCFLLFIAFASAQYFPCSTPCIPEFPNCQESVCDTALGVCVPSAKNPLPSGCCITSNNCQSPDPCLVPSCSFVSNECEFERICGTDDDKPCQSDRECTDNTNICTSEKCVEGFCRTSRIPDVSNPNCCQIASDCPKTPCRLVTCSQTSFTCSYRIDPQGCPDNYYSELERPDPDESSSSSSSYSYTQYSQAAYGAGDYIFAIIGIIILICLVCIFFTILLAVCIQNRRQQL